MQLVPYRPQLPARRAAPGRLPHPQRLRPATPAGSVYSRVERRRPGDRRQHDAPVLLDLRSRRGERRQQQRRALYDPGRRRTPEPPLGIDVWA